ncbi:MAG TPA: hypothetical protein VMM78_12410 [Thermomicrobiales bacterium]|nr:hypothetical protein [Thermomicrobiales bacterium]
MANTTRRVWHFPNHGNSRSQYLPLLRIAARVTEYPDLTRVYEIFMRGGS